MADPIHSEATESSWQDSFLGRRGVRILRWPFWPPWRWSFYLHRPMHATDMVNEWMVGFISVTWVNKRWR